MKKNLFFFFILFHTAQGQNWSVINTSDKFNYRLDGDSNITSTIWVDSFQLISTDTLFFLNRIVCDSCITITGNSIYASKNAPQFLQKKIRFDGNFYYLIDTANYFIHPFANLNDTWIFDSTSNVTAAVFDVTIDSVFHISDSLKKILLSTGDTIILSKNFGILLFPDFRFSNHYYRLAGIEGGNFGERVPDFFDFFDFNIGDRFEFNEEWFWGGAPPCMDWSIIQYTIQNKFITGDTIRYYVSGAWEGCTTCPPTFGCWYGHYFDTLVYIDSADHILNKFNMQPFSLSYRLYDQLPCMQDDSAFDGIRMGNDSNNVLFKSFGIPLCIPGTNYSFYCYTFYNELFSGSDTLFINFNSADYHAIYKLGLGLTEYGLSACFEGGRRGKLTAYSKNNQTFGVFTDSTSILTGTYSPTKDHNAIFPNPVNSVLHFKYLNVTNLRIEIINSLGVIVKKKIIESSDFTIDVSDLPNGIYLVRINCVNLSSIKKFVIFH